ncbi:MAG: hypothetical protein GY870_14115 [archaeon]|nr:hypothetical protein [archaeon]
MIALITDTHYGHSSHSKKIFNRQMEFFEKQFFPFIEKGTEKKIRHVIHGGDLMHDRDFTNNYIMGQLKTRFFQWFIDNQVHLYLLVGNHDCVFKNRIDVNFQRTNLEEFSDYVHIIDEPKMKTIDTFRIGFCPWLVPGSDFLEQTKEMEIDYLVGHFPLNEALMQGRTVSKKGMNVSEFSDFKNVLTGHFHASSLIGNVRYLGSPYQLTWGDYNNDRGFWILDESGINFHPNEVSPRHVKIYYQEDDGEISVKIGGIDEQLIDVDVKEVQKFTKNHISKIIVREMKSDKKLTKFVDSVTNVTLDEVKVVNENALIEDFDSESFKEELGDKESVQVTDVVNTYIDNVEFSDDDIDRKILKQKFRELHDRVKEHE